MGVWRRMYSWRWWVWALVAVIAAGVVAVVAATTGGDETGRAATAPGPSAERSSTTSPAAPTTTTPSPTTPGDDDHERGPSTTTTAPPLNVPGVTTARARPGGGSGEVVVDWRAVTGATGYQVLRAGAPGGLFVTVADVNITTGSTRAADGVTNIWSEDHMYLPSGGSLTAPDRSPWFQYVDIGDPGQRCYRVIAHNPTAEGRASAVTCGSPP